MRKPSDLTELYTYWRLALEAWPPAEAWRKANETRLSIWDSQPMIFPGWYRIMEKRPMHEKRMHLRGQWIPVVIWLEQPIGEDGDLLDTEILKVKTGHNRDMDEFHAEHHEFSLWMTWEKCRRQPVSVEAYNYAMHTYARESVYRWADDAPPVPEKAKPIDLKRARSIF